METISTTTVLERGSKYLGNSPEHLSKRMALAHLLVDARVVRSVDAAILAFRIWAVPESRKYSLDQILALAADKAKVNA
jgi:hypothetical protein